MIPLKTLMAIARLSASNEETGGQHTYSPVTKNTAEGGKEDVSEKL